MSASAGQTREDLAARLSSAITTLLRLADKSSAVFEEFDEGTSITPGPPLRGQLYHDFVTADAEVAFYARQLRLELPPPHQDMTLQVRGGSDTRAFR